MSKLCECNRTNINPLSGICDLCWNEKFPEESVSVNQSFDEASNLWDYQSFNAGAEWQEKQLYNEAIKFAEWIRIKDFQTATKNYWIGLNMKYYTTEELFEQFKKTNK